MSGFLIAAGLATVFALLLLLRPLLWRRVQGATASHRQLNAAIYRDQFAELERDRSEGTLGEEDYQQARTELQRRVLEDGGEDALLTAPQAPKKTLFALAVLVPLCAAGLYLVLGNPEGLQPERQRRVTSKEIEQMVAGLAAKLEREPDNVKGWAMLARSYRAMGRLPEAEKAYDRAEKFIEQDAQTLAEYADIAAANAAGDFSGKPQRLIDKALKLDPQNLLALWLHGSAAYERQDYALAVSSWERIVKQLPPDSDDVQSLMASIAKARDRMGAGKTGK